MVVASVLASAAAALAAAVVVRAAVLPVSAVVVADVVRRRPDHDRGVVVGLALAVVTAVPATYAPSGTVSSAASTTFTNRLMGLSVPS